MTSHEDSPDYPYHLKAVEALKQDGAVVWKSEHDWFCEYGSTFKALKLRRRGEVKRRLEKYLKPYVSGETKSGRKVFVAVEAIPAVVEQEGDLLILMASMRKMKPVIFFPWRDLSTELVVLSNHPAAVEWTHWLCGEFLPAIARHGHYDPATNHEPPPSRLLDALEIRESGRDAMNDIAPGLGDFFIR